ncbi:MAG TPA: hypothetical protein VNH18_10785 [Bryobacteraceae bacterium]|nr:hypothetical protein [Bryobacteraceae bacterium]
MRKILSRFPPLCIPLRGPIISRPYESPHLPRRRTRASLVSFETSQVIREFETDTDKSSGITCDGHSLRIGSTCSREIVRGDAPTGKTLERHFTPGASVIYN